MTMLLRHARIPGRDGTVDVLLKHGVITGIGAGLEGSAETDLDGRWVVPGLWDAHVHLGQAALNRQRVDLSAATSAAHAAALITGSPRPDHGPLIARGFRDGLWTDEPTAHVLDAAVGDVPVVAISGDLHCCWLNSAAMTMFDVTGSTGLLREDDAFQVTTRLEDVPQHVLDDWVTSAARDAAARGVVGVVDLEMQDTVTAWTRRFAAGFDVMRVAAGIWEPWLDRAIAAGLRTGHPLDTAEPRLTAGPFKVISDGSLNTRTAFCVDPYPGLHGDLSRGLLTVRPDRLVELLRRASEAGLNPAVHAIGDRANELVLDAFAEAGCRGRIEHAQLLREQDVPRFAELGVTASVQPEHAMDDRDVADVYWAGRTGRAFVLKSLLDSGADVVLGSDAPVAPLDPWVTIAAAVSRARDGLAPWHPEQAIPVRQAMAASTDGAGHEIAVGRAADLAVLDLDPFAVDAEALRTMPVAATYVAGYTTFDGR
ncbi:MAG: hypothetical protein RI885_168 [Actinomycetota bacterium]